MQKFIFKHQIFSFMKVKFFPASMFETLEIYINSFISDKKVIDVKVDYTPTGFYAIVLYE